MSSLLAPIDVLLENILGFIYQLIQLVVSMPMISKTNQSETSAAIYIAMKINYACNNGDARKWIAVTTGTINTAVTNITVKSMRRNLLVSNSVISRFSSL